MAKTKKPKDKSFLSIVRKADGTMELDMNIRNIMKEKEIMWGIFMQMFEESPSFMNVIRKFVLDFEFGQDLEYSEFFFDYGDRIINLKHK
jgi:hypothetical protein